MHEDSGSSWTRGLKKWLNTAPETRDELLKLVHDSAQFLEPDTVAMLEGVLDLPATKIREIMTPRVSLVSLQEDDELLDVIHTLVDSAHSRFPVFSKENTDTVVGILLAKDLLPFLLKEKSQQVDLQKLMRQPLFVPETARSDQVLRMLKNSQSHLAIVVDEYGTTSGIVAMEDILEEIVGEIEDEHDEVDATAHDIEQDHQHKNSWFVQALTPIELFNEKFTTTFSDEEVETMGGLILQHLGLMNDLEGQVVALDDWQFEIVRAEGHSIQLIRATRLEEPTSSE